MKKVMVVILMLFGAIFLTGCGQQLVSQAKPVAPASVVEQSTQPASQTPLASVVQQPAPPAAKQQNNNSNKIVQVEVKSETFKYTKDGFPIIVDCGAEGCFEKKFISCEPSVMQGGVDIFDAFDSLVEYKIIEKGAIGCNVTFKYNKYPDPYLVNKEMTCPFDNKISFWDASIKVFNGVTTGAVVCKGPLYDILRPKP